MTKEIIIGGVNINTLKAQKQAMQQEATKFVSDAIYVGSGIVAKLLEAKDKDTAETLAQQASEQFENASLVAGTCGVCFMIPYYEEYGDNSEVMSSQIENCENEFIELNYKVNNSVNQLVRLLGSMESESRGWHSSTC